jgi:Protein of unknown function (DUF2786)
MTKERDSILSKIRALLAKTLEAGATEAEAMAALEKAQAMRDAYQVTEEELNLTKEEKAVLRGEPRGTKDPHLIKWQLLSGVTKFCGCRSWKRSGVRSGGGGIVFCGLPTDAQFASWLLDHLAAWVQGELAKHLMDAQPDKQDRKDVIRAFVYGICERINERLFELSKRSEAVATSSNAKALVVVKDAAITDKMKELDIHLSCGYGPCGGGDSASYKAGRAAGDRASFGRPISGHNATLRLTGRH